jgi:ATPase subunit of ABC transporter with duplicated ATPase domains
MSSIDSHPSLLSGELYKHHSLRIAYFHQHQQDCLPFDSTPLQYMASLVGVSSLSLDNNNNDASHSATNSSISTMTIINTTTTNNNGDSQWNEQKLRAHLGSFGISGNDTRIMNLSA